MDGERYISAAEYARRDPDGAEHVWADHVRRERDQDGSVPPVEQVPADSETVRCNYCLAEPAQSAYSLDDESLRAAYAPAFSPAFPMLTCDRCARLFDAGLDEQLLELFAAKLTPEDNEFWSASALSAEKGDTSAPATPPRAGRSHSIADERPVPSRPRTAA